MGPGSCTEGAAVPWSAAASLACGCASLTCGCPEGMSACCCAGNAADAACAPSAPPAAAAGLHADVEAGAGASAGAAEGGLAGDAGGGLEQAAGSCGGAASAASVPAASSCATAGAGCCGLDVPGCWCWGGSTIMGSWQAGAWQVERAARAARHGAASCAHAHATTHLGTGPHRPPIGVHPRGCTRGRAGQAGKWHRSHWW